MTREERLDKITAILAPHFGKVFKHLVGNGLSFTSNTAILGSEDRLESLQKRIMAGEYLFEEYETECQKWETLAINGNQRKVNTNEAD